MENWKVHTLETNFKSIKDIYLEGSLIGNQVNIFYLGGNEVSQCKSCGELINWIKTSNGKFTPVNLVDGLTHWATCPDAKKFKKVQKTEVI